MTTNEYYNVPVQAFCAMSEVNLSKRLNEFEPGVAVLFAALDTEIYFLQQHYSVLRSKRDEPTWTQELMGKTMAVRLKLEHKLEKLKRYEKELV